MALLPLTAGVVELVHFADLNDVLWARVTPCGHAHVLIETGAAVSAERLLATVSWRHYGAREALLRVSHAVHVGKLLVHIALNASALGNAEVRRSIDFHLPQTTLVGKAVG